MAKRQQTAPGQLALLLFEMDEPAKDSRKDWLSWLRDTKKLDEDGLKLAQRLFDELSHLEACERSKALDVVSGARRVDGWEVRDAIEVFGVLDPAIDYHVCWDRAWAARHGLGKGAVRRLVAWDYAKAEPVFEGGERDAG